MIHALVTAATLVALPILILSIFREVRAAFRDAYGA